ncbi:MAG: BMP family protein [Nitrospinota bacterium]
MKRLFVTLSAVVFLIVAILAGGPAWAQKRVALVLPGTISDNGFNQSAYSGLERIRKSMGVKTAFSELTMPPKFVSTLSSYAAQGYEVVVGHGFEFGDPVMKIAKKYPKTKFFVTAANHNVDGKVPNVVSLQPAAREGAYVAGALAGLITKKNRIGIVGGFPFPPIVSQLEGFREGVKATNPCAKAIVSYISTFEDISKGKEAALAHISAGADVLYHVADHAGAGVVQAAGDKGVMAIGWGMDQRHQAPKAVVATHLVDWGGMWLQEVEKYLKTGKFVPGVVRYNMKTGVTDISEIRGPIAQSVKDKVMRIRQDILDGKIKVPFIPKPRPN